MRLYNALCGTLDALTEALTAWAEGERLNTLEAEFAYMVDEDGDG